MRINIDRRYIIIFKKLYRYLMTIIVGLLSSLYVIELNKPLIYVYDAYAFSITSELPGNVGDTLNYATIYYDIKAKKRIQESSIMYKVRDEEKQKRYERINEYDGRIVLVNKSLVTAKNVVLTIGYKVDREIKMEVSNNVNSEIVKINSDCELSENTGYYRQYRIKMRNIPPRRFVVIKLYWNLDGKQNVYAEDRLDRGEYRLPVIGSIYMDGAVGSYRGQITLEKALKYENRVRIDVTWPIAASLLEDNNVYNIEEIDEDKYRIKINHRPYH